MSPLDLVVQNGYYMGSSYEQFRNAKINDPNFECLDQAKIANLRLQRSLREDWSPCGLD